jgi:hypothetical protein
MSALIEDPVTAVFRATGQAADQLKNSASTFVAGFGAVLMVIAIIEVTTFTGDDRRLSSPEFFCLLICGMLLLLVGACFRMYLGVVQAKGGEEYRAWVRDRAEVEADAQIARTIRLQDEVEQSKQPDPPLIEP